MERYLIAEQAQDYVCRLYEQENYPDNAADVEAAFAEGAEWRISAAWHEPSAYGEELKRNVEVIAKTKRGYRFGLFEVVGVFHEYVAFVSTGSLEYALSEVLEYAYLADLVPGNMGGAR